MTDQDRPPHRSSGSPTEAAGSAARPTRTGSVLLRWLVPALAFLAGVLLGVAVMAAADSDDASTAVGEQTTTTASPTTTTSPSRTSPADLTITVPAECVQLADDSRTASNLLDEAVTAARDLDASRMADIVRRMQDARDQLETGATECRNAATQTTTATPTTTG